MKFSLAVILAATMLASCGGEKRKPVFYDIISDYAGDFSYSDSLSYPEYESVAAAEIVSVPFTERGGVKYVDVSVNGVGFEMIFDTGCSGAHISAAEANYLYTKGSLTDDDILGKSQSQIANGTIVEDMVVNLKEVVVGGKIRCTNVTATVSDNDNAPLLLGNEVLNRVASYSIDNENQTIEFKLK